MIRAVRYESNGLRNSDVVGAIGRHPDEGMDFMPGKAYVMEGGLQERVFQGPETEASNMIVDFSEILNLSRYEKGPISEADYSISLLWENESGISGDVFLYDLRGQWNEDPAVKPIYIRGGEVVGHGFGGNRDHGGNLYPAQFCTKIFDIVKPEEDLRRLLGPYSKETGLMRYMGLFPEILGMKPNFIDLNPLFHQNEI